MNRRVFTVGRPPFLRRDQLESLEEAMYGILEAAGIRVEGEDVLAELAAQGFAARDGRVRIERKVAEAFLGEERERNGHRFTLEPRPEEPDRSTFAVGVSNYSMHVHDVERDRVVPYTRETLVAMTKLADALHERGVRCTAPGLPMDVPPPLQPVEQFWISATYSRHGRSPGDIKSHGARIASYRHTPRGLNGLRIQVVEAPSLTHAPARPSLWTPTDH